MLTPHTPQEHLVLLYSQQPCWMIKPLAAELKYSVPSVRRFLDETGYYRSFTHNGKWYTMLSIPEFGSEGLWFFNSIGFSQTGSLTRTLVNLIIHSPVGMTAKQLGEKLQCRCHSILAQLYRHGHIHRRKIGRSHVYFASDPSIEAMQRAVLEENTPSTARLPAEVAVFILAEFIRHPENGIEKLAEMITRNHRSPVDVTQIEDLFTYHRLNKKS